MYYHSFLHHAFFSSVPVVLFATIVAPVHADEPSAENRALAEVLFREAKALSDKEQFEQACPKFQESHRLDPKPGTVLNLAVCHEKQGKVASAWLDYLDAANLAARAGQKDRAKFAKEQAEKLEKTIPRIVVRVPETTAGLVVKLDKVALSEAAWGSAGPINPGEHTIEANAPGFVAWSKTVTIEKTPGNVEIIVPKLEPEPPPKPVDNPADKPIDQPTDKPTDKLTDKPTDKPTDTSPKPVSQEKHVPASEPKPSEFNKPLWIGVAAGGVGLAGIIAGTVFGVQTFNLRDQGNTECGPAPSYTFCTTKGLDLHAQAHDSAILSTTGFVIGGVGIGAGALLVILGLRKSPPTSTHAWVLPQLDRSRAGVWAAMAF